MRHALLGLLLCCALPLRAAGAAEEAEDPALSAALARCPGAAQFMRSHHDDAARAAAAAPAAAAPTDLALRQRLLDMQRVDQQARGGDWSLAGVEKMAAIDAAHLPQIKRIVAEHDGLPSAAQVGGDGVAAAWLLVQHADRDPAFQAEVLSKLAPQVERGEIAARNMAMLTDRVLVAQGKPQRYGTQLVAKQGRWEPKPIEDPQQVDARRASVGDMPLSDYLCMVAGLSPAP
ncbi:hypothetical protein QSH18_19240 [Xanthomonas sp. NCPPB 2654]|uniref:DUF6624 domain-containing protein n=1 Tax=unclassified Xanthomonas TaxID=2643310 RepID=UPI0021E054CB|nr:MULTISPECIES: DUF6624 domain-containing protein [unclassified Xanthomonas]MDL5367748.1 hypothetical protein [Xanthomonas sp. NCPPB 2654]UYC21408.1 hypothetical protein NUG20_03635 [Xanthomonas sp. CFBP 8443]